MGDRYEQIYTFIFYSGILGFCFGALYDFFRIIRMTFCVPGIIRAKGRGRAPKNGAAVNIIVFICDILFFIVAGCVTAIFIFHANNGKIRGIALFGSLLGFIIYYNTIGRIVTRISSFLIKGIYFTVDFFIKKIVFPFMLLLWSGVKGLFRFAADFDERLYTRRVLRRTLAKAEKGFIKTRKDVEL